MYSGPLSQRMLRGLPLSHITFESGNQIRYVSASVRHTFRLHHANPGCIHCEARWRHHLWDGWKLSYSRTYPYEYAKGRLNQSSATLHAEDAGNQSESPKSSLNLATRSSCQWPISFIVPKKNLSTSGSSTHCSPPISERLSHSHLTRSATYFI